ncbi:RNA polymerase subunit sigma-70 [Actinoplanes sp. LDG1-06]|uniref:RNA polymerase sigma factor n=1 Tax=Paractinoplanes ovalisporus TaxID=2810368 RepID=A0ABS2AJ72_9ACTN|nr:RNA polymerase subunit sigma-70 [Actinoplanes ovalisporus]MBM2619890.1 RNA polymerase subunit sigma-70 [Actinoplanes ovalisporus]
MGVTAVLDRARRGDSEAFRELTRPYERELLVHCYRMLGSLTDAEDLLQETMLAAWRGLPGFEGRASLRTWLYRIATNRCLNARRDTGKSGPKEPTPPFTPPTPTRLGEITWLQPYPDELLDGLPERAPGPEARYEMREAVELALVAALQKMPPRQAATLILRDVLGYTQRETAEMLGTTQTAVKGALQRARASVPSGRAEKPDEAVVRRFADAFTRGDVDAVVALLTDDVWLSMPPAPHEYHGRDAVREFLALSLGYAAGRGLTLIRAGANRQPAFVADMDGPAGIIVLTLRGNRIAAIARFHDAALNGRFERHDAALNGRFQRDEKYERSLSAYGSRAAAGTKPGIDGSA